MSEELPPPQLRLRPRKREDEPVVAPPAAVEPAPPQAPIVVAAEVAPLRFRLKPKLAAEPEAAESVSEPTPSLAPATPMASGPEEGVSEMPRLRLKPSAGGGSTGGGVVSPEGGLGAMVPPPILGVGLPGGIQPEFPLVQTEGAVSEQLVGGALPVDLPPSLLEAPPYKATSVIVPSPYKAKAVAKRSKSIAMLAGVVALLLVAGAGGYFVLFAGNEPEVVVAPIPRPVVPRVVPAPAVVVIAPLPPPPTLFKPAPVTESASAVPVKPVITPAFRSWVSNVRVSGVRAGSSSLAIINGRLSRPGDMVDIGAGITFDRLDDQRKVLVFRSSNGAFLEKEY